MKNGKIDHFFKRKACENASTSEPPIKVSRIEEVTTVTPQQVEVQSIEEVTIVTSQRVEVPSIEEVPTATSQRVEVPSIEEVTTTTSTTERSFSAMKIIKTKLRNKMKGRFLANSMTVYIEKEISASISSDSIINDFKSLGTRRVKF
ncbi:hypothetical protein QL285_095109 [Trifolium repens]|nr:hypothetical protein QL285_095109 [Trifolium repens]